MTRGLQCGVWKFGPGTIGMVQRCGCEHAGQITMLGCEIKADNQARIRFSIVGVSMFTIVHDSLHAMELGVAHGAIGHVFFHLCFEQGLLDGPTPSDRACHLWSVIIEQYRALGSDNQLGGLKLSMLCNERAPRARPPE